jgi:poly(3-hydroxyalkanoate) synthetase
MIKERLSEIMSKLTDSQISTDIICEILQKNYSDNQLAKMEMDILEHIDDLQSISNVDLNIPLQEFIISRR